MKENELISVIIPVYNVENYLEKCIESIIAQTYQNLEIIIVNDGSTDNCTNIISRLEKSDTRIKSYYQRNAGLSAARNTGINNCNGEYVAFVDSDDYIHPKMIEILYDNLKKTDADISVCDLFWIDESDSQNEYIVNDITVYEGHKTLQKMIRDDLISVVAWNKLYKRELFDELRYPVGRFHEDEFIILNILKQCSKSVYTTAKLYYYIKRKGSIIAKISARKLEDGMFAFIERYYWAIYHRDRKYAEWCFDAMLNFANYTLKQSEENSYLDLIDRTQNMVKSALNNTAFITSITLRRLIIGYVWLKNPQLSAKIRRFLHC